MFRIALVTFDELLQSLAASARRALETNGISDMAMLAKYCEHEIAAWHGIGKNAMKTIRDAFRCYGNMLKAD